MKNKLLVSLLFISTVFAAKPQETTETKEVIPANGPEVMMIPPQLRAQDFKEAFDYLKKIQTQSKITFTLKDNTKLSQILDVSILPGGTMMNFKINTTQGVQYQIIRIEDIKTITLQ
ncbi:MAG: hypothetical protein EBU93_03715 [Chlamydiae bacterium]|jgi:hypothetical protein|nr:hypothetical protein [Chlamydiota bacterium]